MAAGIYLGWHSPLTTSARTRLQLFGFWEIVSFLLNGFVFISIGLQLREILHELRGVSQAHDCWCAAAGAAVVFSYPSVFRRRIPRFCLSRFVGAILTPTGAKL
jgi:NhaP-type Na+/H+ or K+/H+ antiporter